MNNFLSLGLTKTDYEMSFNHARVISHNAQYEKFEMKLPGCEILGTAARTLAPLTNFPRAAPRLKHCIDDWWAISAVSRP